MVPLMNHIGIKTFTKLKKSTTLGYKNKLTRYNYPEKSYDKTRSTQKIHTIRPDLTVKRTPML